MVVLNALAQGTQLAELNLSGVLSPSPELCHTFFLSTKSALSSGHFMVESSYPSASDLNVTSLERFFLAIQMLHNPSYLPVLIPTWVIILCVAFIAIQ